MSDTHHIRDYRRSLAHSLQNLRNATVATHNLSTTFGKVAWALSPRKNWFYYHIPSWIQGDNKIICATWLLCNCGIVEGPDALKTRTKMWPEMSHLAAARKYVTVHSGEMKSIVVHEDGTKLSYLDSGPPSSTNPAYTTIFAVHGVVFSSPIFQKVSDLCCSANIRFVAINRRGYKDSTPLSDADKAVFLEGTDAQKADWLKSRGLEISNFMNSFIIREDLPANSPEGRGGCVLLGWSLGCSFTLSAIAHIDALPTEVQARLASHLRAHILHEPPTAGLGLPIAPAHMPGVDNPAISDEKKFRILMNWLSSYFEHGDLLTRDPTRLDVVPSITRVPSMWNMSLAEAADIMHIDQYIAFDIPFILNCQHQENANYKAVLFGSAVRDRLPWMTNWLLIGDAGPAICVSVLWSVQDDDEAYGGGNVNYKVLPGMNHFVHWDEPELTVAAYREILF